MMTADDVAEAIALWRSSEGVGLSDGDDAEGIASFLRRNPNTSWIARIEGELAGTVLAGHDGRRGFLYHLAVRDDLRRRGLGRALVDKALESLRAQGILKCHVMVFKTNSTALLFWARMRWQRREDIDVCSLVIDAS